MSILMTPPVGTPIPTAIDPSAAEQVKVNAELCLLVNSGTAALATALLCAKAQHPNKTDVILPAYGCPDLVAAVKFAGLQPVLVEITITPYTYREDALTQQLTDSTIAVVCTTLFGVRMNVSDMRQKIGEDVVLIEDNAQWFPEVTHSVSDALSIFDESFKKTDYSIVSFGRGKPVNLMGGGAVFSHNRIAANTMALVSKDLSIDRDLPNIFSNHLSLAFSLKIRLFEALCNPLLYGLLTTFPFLKIGETKFHALELVGDMSSEQKNLLGTAIVNYRKQPKVAERQYRGSAINNTFVHQTQNRLLRFPVFFKTKKDRDEALKELTGNGVGASPFYAAELIEIPSIRSMVRSPRSKCDARFLANNMLTLPTHVRINTEHANNAIDKCLSHNPQYQCDFFQS